MDTEDGQLYTDRYITPMRMQEYHQTESEAQYDIQIKIGPPALSSAELRELMLSKLLRGWRKADVSLTVACVNRSLRWPEWYSIMRGYWEPWGIHDLPGGEINGAAVLNMSACLQRCTSWYNSRGLWEIPKGAVAHLASFYHDGRRVWGKNELIAWAFRYVRNFQSPDNVWPLAMAKWTGGETYDKLAAIDAHVGLGAVVRELRGTQLTFGGCTLPLEFPVITDWMSLLPVMNNCSLPNATVHADGVNPVICGLCGWSAHDKTAGWREDGQLLREFPRHAADAREWTDAPHLYAARPSDCVWEYTHLQTRALDTWINLYLLPQCGRLRADFSGEYHELTGSKWKTGKKLICKETKAFYGNDGWKHVRQWLHARGDEFATLERNCIETGRALTWFWKFTHGKQTAEFSHADYIDSRTRLINSWAATGIATFPPCFHYLTNHVWEDASRWGPLYWLVGEAGEAAHARDNRMKWGTLRGRKKTAYDRCNTWSMMLRNFYTLKGLVQDGCFDRWD